MISAIVKIGNIIGNFVNFPRGVITNTECDETVSENTDGCLAIQLLDSNKPKLSFQFPHASTQIIHLLFEKRIHEEETK